MRRLSVVIVALPLLTACASAPTVSQTEPCGANCTLLVNNGGNVPLDIKVQGNALAATSTERVGQVNAGAQLRVMVPAPPQRVTGSYFSSDGVERVGHCHFRSREVNELRYDCGIRVVQGPRPPAVPTPQVPGTRATPPGTTRVPTPVIRPAAAADRQTGGVRAALKGSMDGGADS